MPAKPWQIHAGGHELAAGDPAGEPPGWKHRSPGVPIDAGPPGGAQGGPCPHDRVAVRREDRSSPVHDQAGEAHSQQRRPVCEPCLPRADRASGNGVEQVRPRFRSQSTRWGRQSCADRVRTIEAPGKDELWQHRMPRATRRTAHAANRDAMGDPAIAHLAAVGAVEGHGSVARRAARARDDESISEAGIVLHAQLEREDRSDGSFYRICEIPDRGPSSMSVAETRVHLATKSCR